MPRQSNTREAILESASKLFYSEGIRAVSMDSVAEKANVTKKTLYYHFASKDDLIEGYLVGRDQPNLALFTKWFNDNPGPIWSKVQAIFTQLSVSVQHPKWRGCGFLRTAGELANMPGHPAMKAAAKHKCNVERWLADELAGEGVEHASSVARQILILLDGAFSGMLVHRDVDFIKQAGEAAAVLVRAAVKAG